jgi:hypothetical protein
MLERLFPPNEKERPAIPMPSLHFVLPHWLYWGTLIVFPLIALTLVARQRHRTLAAPSLFVAYLFWLCAGFVGLHRFYLRSAWGLVFIPVVLSILYANSQIRDAREDVSRTRSALQSAQIELRRAKAARDADSAAQHLSAAEAAQRTAKAEFETAATNLAERHSTARWLAIFLATMLLIDAALLPSLMCRVRRFESKAAGSRTAPPLAPDNRPATTRSDPALGVLNRAADAIDTLNGRVGEFIAYWAVMSGISSHETHRG